MATVDLAQAKAHLSELLDKVETGEDADNPDGKLSGAVRLAKATVWHRPIRSGTG